MKIPVSPKESSYPRLQFAHDGDAGADLTASEAVVIEPGGRALVHTGISMAIPQGYAGFVLPRSGLAIRMGVTVVNAPGLIDSGYRGELMIGLINHGDETFEILPGDRIAQLVIMAVERPEYVYVEELKRTSRGEAGFGSTGVAGG